MNSPFSSTSAESFCFGRACSWMCGLPKVRFRCAWMRSMSFWSTGGAPASSRAETLAWFARPASVSPAWGEKSGLNDVVVRRVDQRLVHGLGGLGAGGAVDQPRRHAHGGAAGGHGLGHHRAGADLGEVADVDVADDVRPGADEDAFADLGMALHPVGAGAAEGNSVQHGDVVAHPRRLADDDAGAVVDEDAFADYRRRMDVHLEKLGDAALQVEGHGLARAGPQRMGDAVRLQRQEALEEEERLHVAL